MEFKGTKGRWFVDIDEAKVYKESGSLVCICYHTDYLNKVESPFNALLISKAPELLGLLQRMYDEYSINDRISGSLREYMIQANKLLKEATEL